VQQHVVTVPQEDVDAVELALAEAAAGASRSATPVHLAR
jgi:hypothetical protein